MDVGARGSGGGGRGGVARTWVNGTRDWREETSDSPGESSADVVSSGFELPENGGLLRKLFMYIKDL